MTFTTVATEALAAAGISSPSALLVASIAFYTDAIFHTGVGMTAAAAAAEAIATYKKNDIFDTWADEA